MFQFNNSSNLEFLDHPLNDISYAKYDHSSSGGDAGFLVVDLLAKIMILLKKTTCTSSLVQIWSFFVLSTICLPVEVRSNSSSGDAFFYYGSVDC
ncbi:hypothetical protein TorRG33x02_200220 [Trema orientale]|uniref:Uncharacterized protein n=1 Tax=Trema orientale TaxID=63057 RepID=A0A2P5EF22_TREOI|nr:hypothetical protein TorRG33x02_200220 [Trema orientale]